MPVHRNNRRGRQAGVLLTDELDTAIDECRSRVKDIVKECRQKNRKFRDIEFDVEDDGSRCLFGLDEPKDAPKDVQHVTDIFQKPSFFIDGASSRDIIQGKLNDCWFLSALATISSTKGLLEKICVARDEEVGVYGFIFFRDVKWVVVIIDDLLYTDIPKFEELSRKEQALYHKDKDRYNAFARVGAKSLYFARSGTEGETWVPLIEKAYAKLYGCYAALNWGYIGDALEDLTGGVTSQLLAKDILNKDKFWREELCRANNDRTFGCAFDSLNAANPWEDSPTVHGLIGGHAYAVLRAVEYHGKRFVVVRNPWGESEWTGPWSDGSKEWNTEWLPALQVLDHSFGNDGQFVMEYDDFLKNWEEVDRNLLFDSSWAMSYHWLRAPVRPPPTVWTFGDISFTITMPIASPVVIVLSKLNDRFFSQLPKSAQWSIDFVVYRKDAKKPIVNSNYSFRLSRSVNAETHLTAGEYVVHVRLDRESAPRQDNPWLRDNPQPRAYARVLTEKAKSESIIADLPGGPDTKMLPVPLETLAGRDLSELRAELKSVSDSSRENPSGRPQTNPPESGATSGVVTGPQGLGADGPYHHDDEHRNDDDVDDDDSDDEDDKSSEDDEHHGEDRLSGIVNSSPIPPLEDNFVFLGLRVYTKTACRAIVSGQVRDVMPISTVTSAAPPLPTPL